MFDFRKAIADSILGESSKAEAEKLFAGDTPTSQEALSISTSIRQSQAAVELAKARRAAADDSELDVVSKARGLLRAGSDRREIAGIIAGSKGVSATHIRTILRKHAI